MQGLLWPTGWNAERKRWEAYADFTVQEPEDATCIEDLERNGRIPEGTQPVELEVWLPEGRSVKAEAYIELPQLLAHTKAEQLYPDMAAVAAAGWEDDGDG